MNFTHYFFRENSISGSVTFNDKFVFIPTLKCLHRWDLVREISVTVNIYI